MKEICLPSRISGYGLRDRAGSDVTVPCEEQQQDLAVEKIFTFAAISS